jgi:hypothetical protein
VGRKSREKRERRLREGRQVPRKVKVERLHLGPGLDIVRQGRFINYINSQSPEEWRQHVSRLKSMATALQTELPAKVDRLRVMIAALPMRQTLAELTLGRYTAHRETFVESDIPPYLGLEYLTWLYLTNSPRPPLDGEPIKPPQLQTVYELLDDILSDTQWRISSDHLLKPNPLGADMDFLVMRTRTQSLFVRGHAYPHHEWSLVRDLFDPFASQLRAVSGTDAATAQMLANRLGALVNERLEALQDWMRTTSEHWRALLEASELPGDVDEGDRALVEQLKGFRKPAEEATKLAVVYGFHQSRDAFTVEPGDLAVESTGVDDATAFLEFFSLGLDQEAIADSLPSVYEPQTRAPLVNLGDGRWLAHLLPHLTWAAKPAFENIAAQDASLWNKYEPHRSDVLERRSVELIASVSQHSQSFRELYYEFDDGDGLRRYELDGLVMIDGALFLIECKAGAMDASARRGGPARLEANLKELVGEAFSQVSRAERFIRSSAVARFDVNGAQVEVRAGERIFLISTTLDPLNAFVTHSRYLKSVGVIPSESAMWSVYLPDLQVVTDLCPGAGQFIHYLTRRRELEQLRVDANDELDWFGHYLTEGLYFEDVRKGKLPGLHLNTYTTSFDNYYAYLAGERTGPIEKPAQPIPYSMHELIERLESEAPAGFTEAVFALLEGDTEARRYIDHGVTDRRQRAREVGSAGFRVRIGDLVVAYMASSDSAQMNIDAYADLSLAEGLASKSVGILEPTDGGPLIVAVKTTPPAGALRTVPLEELTAKMRSRFTRRGR